MDCCKFSFSPKKDLYLNHNHVSIILGGSSDGGVEVSFKDFFILEKKCGAPKMFLSPDSYKEKVDIGYNRLSVSVFVLIAMCFLTGDLKKVFF